MGDPHADITWHIAHWLGPRYTFGDEVQTGPLSAFNMTEVLDWIAEAPKERAHLIARECPRTLDPNEGGEITRQILIRYGHQEDVQQALLANFGSRGTSGKASERLRERREKARKWLARETEMRVIEWIEMYVSDLTGYIKEFEIREERHF